LGWLGCCWAWGVVCCWPEDVEDVPAPALPCALTATDNIVAQQNESNMNTARRFFICKNSFEFWITRSGNQSEIAYTEFAFFSRRKDPPLAVESASQQSNPYATRKPLHVPNKGLSLSLSVFICVN
jgi:hypothetical protein